MTSICLPNSPASSSSLLFPIDSDCSYKIVKELGDGGQGTVFAALTPRRQHEIAIKVHHKGNEFFANSQNEASVLKLLQECPYFVRYKGDFFLKLPEEEKEGKQHAILMEKFSQTLAIRNKTSSFSIHQILNIAQQALEALQFLQSKHLIHGDLNPQNLSYENNQLIIADMGSALTPEMIHPHRVTQNRWYRSPECLHEQPYDSSIDIWSLGATLFELYTGEFLFPSRGEDNLQSLADHHHLISVNVGQLPYSNPTFPPPSKETQTYAKQLMQNHQINRFQPVWYQRIHGATTKRKFDKNAAEIAIRLIDPMLQIDPKLRIKPDAALELISKLKQYLPEAEEKLSQ